MAAPRTITILGSTGSIGTQTLDVIGRRSTEYQVRYLTCNTRVDDLVAQARVFQPYGVAIREESAWRRFQELYPDFAGPVLRGEEGLCEAAADEQNDVVLSAMVGFSGVVPTMAAIRSGHVIGLANKETLVSAGAIMTAAARAHGATLLAVDSEHSAIAQCLVGERFSDVARLIITASGGPFRSLPANEFHAITPERALRHPNWSMGSKITIDSATLMNKGFEVIEARWLFDLPSEKIDVIVHPQSIIHSMVEFVDGSVKAQMGVPSMLVPIQYALTYPVRLPLDVPSMDLAAIGSLTFEAADTERFPCLRLAYEALRTEGSAACILNAANEVAVAAFLAGDLPFTGIAEVIARTLDHMEVVAHPSLDDIVAIDGESRRRAAEYLSN
ncbi:MAG: 1-deoxy-D-xylulose-5-phosphate reductoisomerase [Candidatus Kapabacteria bacterium]|nr:1-deoxy-D-xylulose-5-phosphate reductoisomerase [Candidatus Kapabacteria bacterium]